MEDGQAPNQSGDTAADVEVGESFDALQICPGNSDFFTFTAAEGDRVTVSIFFSNAEGDLDLRIFRSDDLTQPLGASESVTDTESVAFEAPFAGDFIIEVFGFMEAEATYNMILSQGCTQDADCDGQACNVRTLGCEDYVEPACGGDGDLDPNGSDSRAAPLGFEEATVTLEGLGACVGDTDFFSFTVAQGDSLVASIVPDTNAVMGLFLQDSEGVILTGSADPELDTQTLNAPHLPAGDYKLIAILFEVDGADSESTYTLTSSTVEGPCAEIQDCVEGDGRFFCVDGACDGIEGDGQIALGEFCDSNDDCAGDDSFCFTDANTAAGFICTTECRVDANCDALGEGAYCAANGSCATPCGSDDVCDADSQCLPSGKCDTCGGDADCAERDGQACLVPTFGAGGLCGDVVGVLCGADDNEPNNSSGTATAITLVDGAFAAEGLGLCNDDRDFFVVELAEPGNLTVSMTYDSGADVDIWIVPEGQNTEIAIGISEATDGEEAIGRFLPAGRYSVWIVQFPGDADIDTTYDMSVAFEAAPCTEDADCLATDVRRLTCDAGGCIGFEGNGEVEPGGTCDTTDDCSLDAALCAQGTPEDSFNLCTIQCFEGADCADLDGTTCVDQGLFALCLP
jgi:hypothetical protein